MEEINHGCSIRGQESRRKASGQGCSALGSYATQAGLELTIIEPSSPDYQDEGVPRYARL